MLLMRCALCLSVTFVTHADKVAMRVRSSEQGWIYWIYGVLLLRTKMDTRMT